jgi:hypothetical protein
MDRPRLISLSVLCSLQTGKYARETSVVRQCNSTDLEHKRFDAVVPPC